MSTHGPCRTHRARLKTSAPEWITDSVGARTRWPLMTQSRHQRPSVSIGRGMPGCPTGHSRASLFQFANVAAAR